VAVVAVLQKAREYDSRSPLQPRTRRGLWKLALANAAAAVWMYSVGGWLDETSRVSSVITLGGHHVLVFWLAVVGFGILAATASMTGGFAEVTRLQAILIAVAGAMSVVALAGVISVLSLVVGVVLLISLLGRAFVR
jgi:hypothetical protein